MTAKILVADDSLTIQKVVGITLAETSYELEQCKSESDLYEKVKIRKYDLVLLDFNLSETKSGYDLAKELISISPDIKILVMLGTFDSVDDGQLSAIGVVDKIVKPFESAKFIQKCTEIIESDMSFENSEFESDDEMDSEDEDSVEETEEISLSDENDISDEYSSDESDEEDSEFGEHTEEIVLHEMSHTDSDEDFEDGDVGDESALEEGADYFKQEADEDLVSASEGWEIDSPSQEDESLLENSGGLWEEEAGESMSEESGSLESEIASWGMEIPGVIGSNSGSSLFPPVIDESSANIQMVKLHQLGEELEDELENDFDDSHEEEMTEEVESPESKEDDEDEVKLPVSDDLDYPDMGPSSEDIAAEPKSKLVSMEELAPMEEDDEEEYLDATDPLIEQPIGQSQLADEINNELSPDEFWAVDEKGENGSDFTINEFVEGAGANPDMVGTSEMKIESHSKNDDSDSHDHHSHSHEHEEVVEIEIDKDEIVASIMESLKPMIKEMVRELCRDKVEQIAWEVIPDLAENLIKKEIREISDSVN